MRTVIGLVRDKAEARRTQAELATVGASARNVSIVSREGADGPIAAYLDERTGTQDPEAVTNALVRMGLSQDEARRYVVGLRQGYTLEAVSVDDAIAPRVLEVLRRHSAVGAQPSGRAGPERTEEVLPVVVEQLEVGKRQVQAGGVRVTLHVREVPVEEDVALREERVNVERRKVDRPVSATEASFQDRTIELATTREEAVVAKHARVVEEIVVTKEVAVRHEKLRDTVRRTDVDVQQLPFEANRYQEHYRSQLAALGGSFDTYAPAYRFGHEMRSRDDRDDLTWESVEGDARSRWERDNPGTWDRFRHAIRHAWEKAVH